MRAPNNIFGRLPVAKRLLLIVAIFVAIVVCVFYLGSFRSEVVSGVRAYVGGESLWSKAEKEAAISLTRYADTHADSDYRQYLQDIAVPLGDKQARLQLQNPNPDMALVSQGFVQGRNNPEDIENMAMLFRRFGHVGYMAKAIAIWNEGDRYIDQLREVATELHQEITSPNPNTEKIQDLLDRVEQIDAQLTPLEDQFSSTLGEGARWINRMSSVITQIASGFLLLLGVGLSIGVVNHARDSEEKYRNLIDTANDAILVIDSSTRVVVEANHKASELLAIPRSSLIGMPEARLYPVEHEERYRALVTPESPAGAARGHELELLRSDGVRVPVEVSASRTELNGRDAVLGIFRDIRERVFAADILRRSQDRFEYLIENLSDVITVVAVDGTMLYHSPSIERVTGYKPSELLGRSLLDQVHADDFAAVQGALEQVTMKPGTATAPGFRFRHKDGTWIWLDSSANNLLNDAAVGGIVVTSRDVSARRALEEQVRQAQKMEAVGRLAGGIAHDFNNLLMVIRGYAEILQQQASDAAAVRPSIDTIVRTTESAASLTRQLLSFSRKHVFAPQILDLNSIVGEMEQMIRGLLGEEIELSLKLAPGIGSISADPGQLEQVVLNLVVNARDAMPKGGKLVLTTANVDAGHANTHHAVSLAPGEYITLSVSDTGVGMDSETASRIFEPFFTTKGKNRGSGLGLAVVYNIVRDSGGQVTVHSELGHGSTFQVFFPRTQAAPKPAEPQAQPEASRSGTETILVAEDQPDLRWMICQFLQELGYSVLETKDGNDAIALAEQYSGTIDVLLTDVVMPGLRGPEVAKRLGSARPAMKVIYMSGYTEGRFDAGADSEQVAENHEHDLPHDATLLQKPFKLQYLATKIREVLTSPSRR